MCQVTHTWKWVDLKENGTWYITKKKESMNLTSLSVCDQQSGRGVPQSHLINTGDHLQHRESLEKSNQDRSTLLWVVICDCTPSVYVADELSLVHSWTFSAELQTCACVQVKPAWEQRLSAPQFTGDILEERHKCSGCSLDEWEHFVKVGHVAHLSPGCCTYHRQQPGG